MNVSQEELLEKTVEGIAGLGRGSTSNFGYIDNNLKLTSYSGPCHWEFKSIPPNDAAGYLSRFVPNRRIPNRDGLEYLAHFLTDKELSPWADLFDYSLEYKGTPVYSAKFMMEHEGTLWLNRDTPCTYVVQFFIACREYNEFTHSMRMLEPLVVRGVDPHLAYAAVRCVQFSSNSDKTVSASNNGHSFTSCPGSLTNIIRLAQNFKHRRRFTGKNYEPLSETSTYSPIYGYMDEVYGHNFEKYPRYFEFYEETKELQPVTGKINHASFNPKPVKDHVLTLEFLAEYLKQFNQEVING